MNTRLLKLALAGAGMALAGICVAQTAPQAAAPAATQSAPKTIGSRYTFSWPVGPEAPAPRGGTTRGVPVELDTAPSAEWQALQQSGLSAQERDRRAILAMAGSFRVNFDFLEVTSFVNGGARPQPYQSWGTERVFVDINEPGRVSLVHILEMRILGADGKPSEPMVTRHWRQDWRFEPAHLVEFQGGTKWARRAIPEADRRGVWSQTVYQVDEAPRYGSLGRWEHNGSFSSWISGETARPLPRREWSVRKDYDVLRGTNRHTVTGTGWIQEENNLKAVASGAPPVGREYGVARYERLKNADFSEAGKYYQATRVYWDEVLAVWDELWMQNSAVTLSANSDQSGAFMGLFELADEFAAGRLTKESARPRIREAITRQMVRQMSAPGAT